MRVIRGIGIGVLACVAIRAQPAPARLEFEVASIKPSPAIVAGQPGVNIGLHIDGALVRCTDLSLNDYISMAYKVRHYQISGADWMASDRFDINAKLPDGSGRQQVPEMLKTLLESRFQLKMHRDSKPLPVYALVVAKGGLKMKEVPVEPPDGGGAGKGAVDVNVNGGRGGLYMKLGQGSSFAFGNNRLEAKKLSMTGLVDMLGRFMDRPVIDMTELKGNFDFTVELTPDDFRSMMIRSAVAAGIQLPPEALRLLDRASDSSLHTGLQELGLRLEPRKAPVEILVVDHADRTPTEN